jgi:hypothetical protein
MIQLVPAGVGKLSIVSIDVHLSHNSFGKLPILSSMIGTKIFVVALNAVKKISNKLFSIIKKQDFNHIVKD